jgi:hypothetical protein
VIGPKAQCSNSLQQGFWARDILDLWVHLRTGLGSPFFDHVTGSYGSWARWRSSNLVFRTSRSSAVSTMPIPLA